MASALHSLVLSNWRTVLIAAACAAAGGGLRWGIREHDPVRADSALTSPVAPVSRPPVPLTADSLPSLSGVDRLTALAAQLPRMSVQEIAPLVAALAASVQEVDWDYGIPNATRAMLRALFTRWAELDADGMIAALEAPAYQFAFTTRQLAVSAWVELRGMDALDAVKKQWPGIAPHAAWEVLRRHPEQLEALLPLLDRDDRMIPNLEDDRPFIEQLGPERYVRLAAAMKKDGYVGSFLGDLAVTDFSRAFGIAKALPAGELRNDAQENMLRNLYPDYGNIPVFRAEFEALPQGELRDRCAGTYAEVLAQESSDAALAWARSLPAGKARRDAVSAVADGIRWEVPADATRLYAEAWTDFHDTETREPISTFRRWHGAEPAAAEAWFQSITDPGLRAELAPVLHDDPPAPEAVPAAQAHADALAAIVKAGVKDEAWSAASTEDRRLLAADAVRYRTGYLKTALEFFDAMAPEERSLGAWYEAGRAHVHRDLNEASQWAASLPDGPERDAAATALVEYLIGAAGVGWSGLFFPMSLSRAIDASDPFIDRRDGEAAFSWAAGMSGEIERSRYMAQAARAWAIRDAASARAAVAASDWPEADKQSLLQQLPEGGPR